MSAPCENRWQELVSFAQGNPEPELETHLESCQACQRGIVEIQQIIDAFSRKQIEAPQELIDRALGIFPKPQRIIAVLRSSSLNLDGVRGYQGDLHALFIVGDHHLRVNCRRSSGGWRVLGQGFPEMSLADESGHEIFVDESGRFEMVVKSLTSAEIHITWPGNESVVYLSQAAASA